MKSLSQLFTIILGLVGGIVLTLALIAGQSRASAAAIAATPTVTAVSSETACNNNRAVQVSGAAALNVTPDRALIQLGVTSSAVTPEQAQAANTEDIQQVVAAIRQLGIPDKDIATDYFLIQPVYDDHDPLQINGYRVQNMVGVTLDEVSKTGDVLTAALKAGANEVRDVQFYTSELRRYRDQARDLAMKAATEKAQALAKTGGAQTGCLLQISENSWSYYNGSGWGSRDRAMWSQNVVQNIPGDQPATDETPVNVGQIVVRAEVNVSYSLN